ncbi:hypothetical protein CANCADRAFT_44125 [Tortispora caseinolytica NRRL Y-17796]|uniref:Mediator of RNA polymerase II transcription subunit 18 n=1 Tax=Tortispora caseinolytica NRRL Y-17796 TaxID=767744 RepID=A0A1E4TFC0_9ASCO|nr:hypothetical protein CANCADRAFT_44125 [Tortispora caseinolytica NRRL Y-17796]
MVQVISLQGSIPSPKAALAFQAFCSLTGDTSPATELLHRTVHVPKQANKKQASTTPQFKLVVEAPLRSRDPWGFEKASTETIRSHNWSIIARDVPETTTSKQAPVVVSYSEQTSKLGWRSDARQTLQLLGYKPALDYRVERVLFVYRSASANAVPIVLRVFRLLAPRDIASPDSDWQLLDPSGTWIVDASVTVENVTDRSAVAAATNALRRLATELKPVVELCVTDRTAFDMRVR